MIARSTIFEKIWKMTFWGEKFHFLKIWTSKTYFFAFLCHFYFHVIFQQQFHRFSCILRDFPVFHQNSKKVMAKMEQFSCQFLVQKIVFSYFVVFCVGKLFHYFLTEIGNNPKITNCEVSRLYMIFNAFISNIIRYLKIPKRSSKPYFIF